MAKNSVIADQVETKTTTCARTLRKASVRKGSGLKGMRLVRGAAGARCAPKVKSLTEVRAWVLPIGTVTEVGYARSGWCRGVAAREHGGTR